MQNVIAYLFLCLESGSLLPQALWYCGWSLLVISNLFLTCVAFLTCWGNCWFVVYIYRKREIKKNITNVAGQAHDPEEYLRASLGIKSDFRPSRFDNLSGVMSILLKRMAQNRKNDFGHDGGVVARTEMLLHKIERLTADRLGHLPIQKII